MKILKIAKAVLLLYFWISFLTLGLDLEVVVNPGGMFVGTHGWWIPWYKEFLVWWGATVDPLFVARPVWFWLWLLIEMAFFGPYAIFGFVNLLIKKFDRQLYHWTTPVYIAVLLIANAMVILEELIGQYPSTRFLYLLAFNSVWLIGPLLIITLRVFKVRTDEI